MFSWIDPPTRRASGDRSASQVCRVAELNNVQNHDSGPIADTQAAITSAVGKWNRELSDGSFTLDEPTYWREAHGHSRAADQSVRASLSPIERRRIPDLTRRRVWAEFRMTHDRLTDCELISNPNQMPRVLQTAMQHAVSKRGSSVIVLPGDVAAMPAPSDALAHQLVTAQPLVRPADADIERLASLLNEGSRVTLFCGIGCADAREEVLALAKKLQAPVGYSFRGKEWLEYDNPYAVGTTGLSGWGARLQGDARVQRPAVVGHGFPLRELHAGQPQDRLRVRVEEPQLRGTR